MRDALSSCAPPRRLEPKRNRTRQSPRTYFFTVLLLCNCNVDGAAASLSRDLLGRHGRSLRRYSCRLRRSRGVLRPAAGERQTGDLALPELVPCLAQGAENSGPVLDVGSE